VLRLFHNSVIGGYNCSKNVKTLFIYKCASEHFTGYSLKKVYWVQIINDFGAISDFVRKKIESNYISQIKRPVLIEQSIYLKKLNQRSDHQFIQLIVDRDNKNADLENRRFVVNPKKEDPKKELGDDQDTKEYLEYQKQHYEIKQEQFKTKVSHVF